MTKDLLARLDERIASLSEQDSTDLLIQRQVAWNDEMEWLLPAMALVHWFDVPLVEKIVPDDWRPDPSMDFVGQGIDYIGLLLGYSFVEPLPEMAGQKVPTRYIINRSVRARLLERWKDAEQRERLVAQSRQLRDEFQRRSKSKKISPLERPLLEREALYHQFIADENTALEHFRSLFNQAEANYQFGVCQALVNLAREQEAFFQSANTGNWLQYYQGRLHLLLGEDEAAQACFTQTLQRPHLSYRLRGRARAGLGDVWRARGAWSQALVEYEAGLDALLNLRLYRVVEQTLGTSSKALQRFTTTPAWGVRLFEGIYRRFVLARTRRNEIRAQAAQSPERLEAVRVLTAMAELALTMAQPDQKLDQALAERQLSQKREAPKPQATSRDWKRILQSGRKWQALSEEDNERRSLEQQQSLLYLIQQQLLRASQDNYEIAISILSSGEAASDEKTASANLLWDIRFGLATVKRLLGRVDQALESLTSLETENLSPREQAQLEIALGECYLDTGSLELAGQYCQQALQRLENSWDRPTWAKALLRLGYIQALRGEWQSAVENLEGSRKIYASLKNPRWEEKAQEALRQVRRSENAPEDARQQAAFFTQGWQEHHFANAASRAALQQVKKVLWPLQLLVTALLSGFTFVLLRPAATWLLDLLRLASLAETWYINAFLIVVSIFFVVVSLDISRGFQRLVARILAPRDLGEAQPPLFSLDEERFSQVDSAGERRSIAWQEVTEVRHAVSSDWVSAEASLLATGKPGGRTLIFGRRGVLAFDSSAHSYQELKEKVQQITPPDVQRERKFSSSIRSLVTTWLLIIPILGACFACPAWLLLGADNPAWWLTVLKWVVGGFVAFMALGLMTTLIWALNDAARLQRYIYPKGIEEPPVSLLSESRSHYLEDERRSV
ncbi:MAG: tetratricopeptide repeat protein [Anaerolineales bacterium]|nr:tetratricopeptide repeat protein [Anaerolineales bacterium]